MRRIFLTLCLWLAAAAAFALPTVEQVQAEVKAGRYPQAEAMMQEVVSARPQSAKAHYVYAEILAHNGRFDEAARQARQAREIDPAIRFTDPANFRSFEALLQRQQEARSQASAQPAQGGALASPLPGAQTQAAVPAPTRAAAHEAGLPGWLWIVGIVAVVWLLWRLLARRTSGPAGYAPGAVGPYASNGLPVQPRSGSGLLGTGIAAAGGFAAGMLAEKMLEGDHHQAAREGERVASAGGLQPGMFDDYGSAASELEQRSIDFGSGGDWGGDAGGGMDAGGGGDW